MKLNEILELVTLLKDTWEHGKPVAQKHIKKIRELFRQGKKNVGFARNPKSLKVYMELSKGQFARRYAPYIRPTEYRGYLVQSLYVKKLYAENKRAEGDKKRNQMHRQSPVAGRICNLFTSGMLTAIWKQIDNMEEAGLSHDAITGRSSQILDDLIQDKSIIYVNQNSDAKELVTMSINAFKKQGYLMAFGAASQTKKVEKLRDTLQELPEFEGQRFEIISWREAETDHYCLTAHSQAIIED